MTWPEAGPVARWACPSPLGREVTGSPGLAPGPCFQTSGRLPEAALPEEEKGTGLVRTCAPSRVGPHMLPVESCAVRRLSHIAEGRKRH